MKESYYSKKNVIADAPYPQKRVKEVKAIMYKTDVGNAVVIKS